MYRTVAGSGPTQFLLRLDRPYGLMICDHATDFIMFVGKIMEPKVRTESFFLTAVRSLSQSF